MAIAVRWLPQKSAVDLDLSVIQDDLDGLRGVGAKALVARACSTID